MKLYVLLFFMVFLYPYGHAQVKLQPKSDSTIEAYITAANASSKITPNSQSVDAGLLQTALEKQELQHRIAIESYNQRVYEWSLFNSKIIFWLVVFLVLSGVALSGFQFYEDHLAQLKYHKLTDKLASRADNKRSSTEAESMSIEANLKGIKFNSNIIGMMILVISLLFFYLYLKYVYPIH
jgi:hypothetical protein